MLAILIANGWIKFMVSDFRSVDGWSKHESTANVIL